MARAKPSTRVVQSIEELELDEIGMLPGGIKATRCVYADSFEGDRESLIAAGIAKAEWFPAAPVFYNGKRGAKGHQKRRFSVETERGKVRLDDYKSHWYVCIPCKDEEREARHREYGRRERAKRDAEAAQQERTWRGRWNATQLPTVSRESVTQAELSALALIRVMDEESREMMRHLMETFIVSDGPWEKRQRALATKRGHLTIIK